MITKQELTALIQLLQRTPVSTAEMLWVNSLLARLQQTLKQNEKKEDKE